MQNQELFDYVGQWKEGISYKNWDLWEGGWKSL